MLRTFSPVPKRVMDGSEPGEIVAAAVLSGAPVDLQARQVRYVMLFKHRGNCHLLTFGQNISTSKDGYSVRDMACSSMEDGLGHSAERSSMGESVDGVAIHWRFDAQHTSQF